MAGKIEELQTTVIKCLLFEHYSSIGNNIVYKNLNDRSKWNLRKINDSISEEGYRLWEKQLCLIE